MSLLKITGPNFVTPSYFCLKGEKFSIPFSFIIITKFSLNKSPKRFFNLSFFLINILFLFFEDVERLLEKLSFDLL